MPNVANFVKKKKYIEGPYPFILSLFQKASIEATKSFTFSKRIHRQGIKSAHIFLHSQKECTGPEKLQPISIFSSIAQSHFSDTSKCKHPEYKTDAKAIGTIFDVFYNSLGPKSTSISRFLHIYQKLLLLAQKTFQVSKVIHAF